MNRGRWAALGASLAGLALLAALWSEPQRGAPPEAPPVAAVPTSASPVTAAPGALPASGTGTGAGLRSTAAFEAWLDQKSSLRGAQLDGDWGLDARGQLHPSLSLRRRFDQLLTLVGDTSLEQLRLYVEAKVRAQAEPQVAAQVLDIWQRYVQLMGTPFKQAVDPKDWRTWQAALSEQHQVRYATLGPAWANAFFRDEEEQLLAQIRSAQAREGNAGTTASTGTAASAPGADMTEPLIRREELTAQQNERLQEAEADWSRWKRRVAEARQAVAQLQQAPELSEQQRQQAITRWLAERFDANEQRRVRALIEVGADVP